MNDHLNHATQLLMLLASIGSTALADNVTVTQLDDSDDFAGARMIADLPGPDGLVSLREAVVAVNNTPGNHRIEFAVPVDPADPLGTLLRIEGSAFVVTRDNTTIDFLSQAIFMGDPDPDGPGLGILNTSPSGLGQPAIIINASACEIRGLGRTQFRDSIEVVGGHNNRFVRNFTDSINLRPGFGSTTTGNVIGGTGSKDGNDIGVVSIDCGADNNIVIGNRVESINITGSPFCADGTQFPTGNRIGGPSVAERNLVSGFGTYSGEGRPSGTGILVGYARDTVVEGNYIGVNSDGLSQASDMNRGTNGIQVRDSTGTVIRGNVISGIRGIGISGFAGQVFGRAVLIIGLNEPVDDVVIEDNIIGLDANRENPIPTRAGIQVITQPDPVNNVLIKNNTIAGTEQYGIQLNGFGVDQVEISQNAIFDNGGLGIELLGANSSPSVPTLESAVSDGTTTTVSGELIASPDDQFRIEIFASETCDASGSGEGEVFLGSFVIDTDASGSTAFDQAISGATPEGWVVTATATSLTQHTTSAFSVCVAASSSPCSADLNGDGELNFFDVSVFLNAYNAMDPAADFTGDGNFDFFDVSAFLNSYNAGCP